MSGLTPVQERAIALLVSGETGRSTAETVGVSEATIRRWRHQPAFQEAMEARLREMTAEAIGALRGAVREAVQVYVDCIADPDADWKDRLKAADGILDRVGVSPTTRVEVSGDDPIRRLKELFGVEVPERGNREEPEPEGA